MKNELGWVTAENSDFPMHLTEKGLDFSKRTAFFFYFSGIVAVLSMFWVMLLSVKLIYMAHQDPTVPEYYKMVAFVCLAIGAASLFSFYKLYMDRRAYQKTIDIENGQVSYCETTRKGTIEWKEKVKKFEGMYLKHYTYRGVESWYIALVHADTTKSFPVFAPEYESRLATEVEKRTILAQYGSKFGLMTIYEKEEDKGEEEVKQ